MASSTTPIVVTSPVGCLRFSVSQAVSSRLCPGTCVVPSRSVSSDMDTLTPLLELYVWLRERRQWDSDSSSHTSNYFSTVHRRQRYKATDKLRFLNIILLAHCNVTGIYKLSTVHLERCCKAKSKKLVENIELDESIKQSEQITDLDNMTISGNDRTENLSGDVIPAQHSYSKKKKIKVEKKDVEI
ncbi:hypothetical protein Taro_007058 [Colocasia esculenta]|uniref:Uncharacterized protein n=1 Tax=Colocasia esculenta TaxID=4460 RepID=A0A843TXV2_COLES|nr:hypothetical protein [Colocasia esculenta]